MAEPVVQPLIVGIPTHDGRYMIQSSMELLMAARTLGRPLQIAFGHAGNIPVARNRVMAEVRAAYARQSPLPERGWMLWLDSDIAIQAGGGAKIAEAVLWAEANQKWWTANYHKPDRQNVLLKDRSTTVGVHYTQEELEALPDYAEIGMTGFGCLYVQQPLTYEFHADHLGEDIHFWAEHPHDPVYYAKQIPLLHYRATFL